MKVYGVHQGCKYEGCWLVALYTTKELATKKAEELVEIWKDRHTRLGELGEDWMNIIERKEENGLPYWERASDLILVLEQEILES